MCLLEWIYNLNAEIVFKCLFILDYERIFFFFFFFFFLVLFNNFTCKFVFCFVFIYFALEVPGNSSVVEYFGIS